MKYYSLSSLLGISNRPRGGPDYIPLTDSRSGSPQSRTASRWDNRTNPRPTPAGFILAIFSGFLICLVLLSFRHHPLEYNGLHPPGLSSIFSSPLNDALWGSDNPTLEELRDIVARSNGYWARDYSLNLGWNNVSA